LSPYALRTCNAGRGKFSKKVPLLAAMGADIAVIPEIAKPELTSNCLKAIKTPTNMTNETKK